MESKKPLFMPAPRPTARLSPEDAKRLVEGAADLGFDRLSGAPVSGSMLDELPAPAAVKPQAFSVPETATPASVSAAPIEPFVEKGGRGEKSKPNRSSDANPGVFPQTLRVDVPDDLWVALKLASIHRKTSVKFLMLEALGKAGYPVDLDAIPEDGRRLR